MPNTLADWLSYLESLHPKTIALGLERVAQVKQRLNLQPDFPIIIVGGNIRGYTRTMTTAIALETSKGDLSQALALGMILVVLSIAVSSTALYFGRGLKDS